MTVKYYVVESYLVGKDGTNTFEHVRLHIGSQAGLERQTLSNSMNKKAPRRKTRIVAELDTLEKAVDALARHLANREIMKR